MGNILVIDMGHIIMRFAIVDKDNVLQKLFTKLQIEKDWETSKRSFPYELINGFNLAMTVDLPLGKLYFLRYNIIEHELPTNHLNAIVELLKREFANKENEPFLKSPSKMAMNDFAYSRTYPEIIKFDNARLKCIASSLNISKEDYYINSTGGYNDHYLKKLSETFNVQVKKNHSYIYYIINAIDFLNSYSQNCFFTSKKQAGKPNILTLVQEAETHNSLEPCFYSVPVLYPYLLVLVRSGATYYRVDSLSNVNKVGSSLIGGATYFGLIRLLTKYKDPERAADEATYGNNMAIDLSVGDIYGCGLKNLGLNEGTIASSFAKASTLNDESKAKLKDNDISRSCLSMIIINLLQIAYLYAKSEHLERIVIVGTKFMNIELVDSIEV